MKRRRLTAWGVSRLRQCRGVELLLCSAGAHAEQTALMQQAMRAAQMPLQVLSVEGVEAWPPEYRHAWHIVRQDSHVVWRGDQITPDLALAVVNRLRGATPS